MHLFEKTIDTQTVFEGKVFTVQKNTVLLENGKTAPRELVIHSGGSGILPIDNKGNVTLVKQFRYGPQTQLIEICAGKTEKGEDPRECAVRELREELGMIAETVTPLGQLNPTPAYDSEKIYIFLATGITLTETDPDEGEFLDVLTMPLEKAVQMCFDGSITDAKTQIALLKAERLINGKD